MRACAFVCRVWQQSAWDVSAPTADAAAQQVGSLAALVQSSPNQLTDDAKRRAIDFASRMVDIVDPHDSVAVKNLLGSLGSLSSAALKSARARLLERAADRRLLRTLREVHALASPSATGDADGVEATMSGEHVVRLVRAATAGLTHRMLATGWLCATCATNATVRVTVEEWARQSTAVRATWLAALEAHVHERHRRLEAEGESAAKSIAESTMSGVSGLSNALLKDAGANEKPTSVSVSVLWWYALLPGCVVYVTDVQIGVRGVCGFSDRATTSR